MASELTGFAFADLDLDGFQDVVVASFFSNVSVLLNDGAGGFGAAMTFSVPSGRRSEYSVAVARIDSDMDMDIALTNLGNSISRSMSES